MKTIIYPIMCCVVLINLCCDTNDLVAPVLPISPGTVDNFSRDVQLLAAGFGTTPWIDSVLASQIAVALSSARTVNPDLAAIHIYGGYVLTQLIVEPSAAIGQRWSQGSIDVGDPYLDNLASQYGLELVVDSKQGWFILNFRHSMNIPNLAKIYAGSPNIVYAEPNYFAGDGDQIYAFSEFGSWDFVFSHGQGDCPAGCIWRNFFYVTVTASHTASLVRELEPPINPDIYLWNVPPRYIATLYSSAQDIIDHYHSGEWWIQQHAIEVTWRLVVNTVPWDGADMGDNKPLWDNLRKQILERRKEIVQLLEKEKRSADYNVHASAERALRQILQ